MPIRLQGNDQSSIHKHFFNALMGANSDSLALSQLWVCTINSRALNRIGEEIYNYKDRYEDHTWNTPDGQAAVNASVLAPKNFSFLTPELGDGSIYLLAQGVSFIADGLDVSRVGVEQSGSTKGLIVNRRLDLNATTVTFLESNVSFVDGFVRPWSALVGHRSLKCASLRCDIAFHCLEKWSLYEPLKIRKTMLFKNAVPIAIDQEELNYSADKVILRQVQFAFDRYEMCVHPALNNTTPTAQEMEKLIKDQLGNTATTSHKSILNKAQDALATVNNTVNKVSAAATNVTTAVARGLAAVGLQKEADKVTKINQKAQEKVIKPIGTVIGTGSSVIRGTEDVLQGVGKLGVKDYSKI